MNSKKNWSKILLVLGVLIGVVGVSYAFWRASFSSKNDNSLTATCFNVSFTDQNNISIEKAYPLLDKDGKKLTPYEFTITNNCDTYVKYDINLEVLNTSTLTNMDYIKLMLDDGTPALVSSYNVTTKTLSNASSAYKISTGYLNAKESKTYNLRLWLDENMTGETEGVQNNTFTSKITVNASYVEELPTASEYITPLATVDTTNLATDDYSNTRYIGANPNNYIWFDEQVYQYDTYSLMYGGDYYGLAENTTLEECQNAITDQGLDGDGKAECKKEHSKGDKILWQIIGVMKGIDDGTGNKEDRVKLIRASSIGSYSWDTSESSINSGYGVNEWSQADVMKLLNPGYESESVGGSLYWNNQSGTCYNISKNGTTSCNFTSTGIKDKLKILISDAVWNTGASTTSNQIASKFYTEERGTRNGKKCLSGTSCNDTVERTMTWTGKVGLMYLSDYGYATSGGDTTDRTTCLNTSLRSWDDSSLSDCKNNDWLFNSSYQWTLSPNATRSNADFALYVDSGGNVGFNIASNSYAVRPVVYLTSNVKISSGSGSESDPFELSL